MKSLRHWGQCARLAACSGGDGAQITSRRRLATAADAAQVHTASLDGARAVIRLGGPEVIDFLQGLLTNDVAPLARPGAPPLYSCLLSAQGRHLHDMFLWRADGVPGGSGGASAGAAGGPVELLADVDARGKDDLLRTLRRYRLRRRVAVDDAAAQLAVRARWRADGGPPPAAAAWRPDPRLPQLGQRALVAAGAGGDGDAGGTAPAHSTGAPPAQLLGWRDHARWRLGHGVAEGDAEMASGEAIPLEFCVDGLGGISFSKGCYVGQELMARTHFKGVVRKRVMPFEVVGGAEAAAAAGLGVGAEVCVDAPGGPRPAGRVAALEGGAGLALVRLARALPAAAAGAPLLAPAGGARLLVRRPAWWPPEWGHEEE